MSRHGRLKVEGGQHELTGGTTLVRVSFGMLGVKKWKSNLVDLVGGCGW